jgi:hypothetical protein
LIEKSNQKRSRLKYREFGMGVPVFQNSLRPFETHGIKQFLLPLGGDPALAGEGFLSKHEK